MLPAMIYKICDVEHGKGSQYTQSNGGLGDLMQENGPMDLAHGLS